MKHDDETLQAAIDAALIESEANVCEFAACPETFPKSWAKESPARLALAKAFLAKLPEAQPVLADMVGFRDRAEKAEAALAESEKQFQAKVTELLETLDRAEKAEAELAALKSSPIGTLRPLAEAGPVPDGCVRVTALKNHEDEWAIGDSPSQPDTHFADIRIPSSETPAQTVNEQPKQKVPLEPKDVLPGSIVTNSANSWYSVKYVTAGGVRIDIQGSNLIDYEKLKTYGWQINRSIPLTGKWDATAWEPCSKPGK